MSSRTSPVILLSKFLQENPWKNYWINFRINLWSTEGLSWYISKEFLKKLQKKSGKGGISEAICGGIPSEIPGGLLGKKCGGISGAFPTKLLEESQEELLKNLLEEYRRKNFWWNS